MSWEIFKQNVLRVANNPQSINDIDIVAKTYATEYDNAVKRGGDTVNGIPIEIGNVEIMEQIFKSALQKGLSSTEPYDLVGEMGKGVVAYWAGATMRPDIPEIPAIGASQNTGVIRNIVINPGTWAPVSVIPSTAFQLTPEEKLDYQNRLQTEINKYETEVTTIPTDILEAREDTISKFTGIVENNENYRVDIPVPFPIVTGDTKTVDINGNEVNTTTTTTATNTGETDEQEDSEIAYADDGGTRPPARPKVTIVRQPPYNPGNVYSGEGYGASVSFGKLSVLSGGPLITVGDSIGSTREQFLKTLNFADGLTISGVDMSKDWAVIATQYISKKEGFTDSASWDVNAYRLGFGTDKILGNDGNLRKVLPTPEYYKQTREEKPVNGDKTTREAALKVLELQIRTTYKDKVVGTAASQITEEDWNALNDRQRAGLVSFVYNCGSFAPYPSIPIAIKSKNYIAAANGILNGPISGKNTVTGKVEVYSGLIRRRAEEAGIFAYGL